MRQFRNFAKAAAAIAMALSVWIFAPVASHAEESGKIAVVELFTSQGCSSCPPADKVLGELVRKPNVLALTMNVDYWDYLGWADTLASKEHTTRQKEYLPSLEKCAPRRLRGVIYTPQFVIGGQCTPNTDGMRGNSEEEVSSEYQKRVVKLVDAVLAKPTDDFVPVNVTAKGEEVTIEVGKANGVAANDATLWLMLITRKVEQKIRRGENRGRKIAYYNVVRKMLPVGMWHGDAMKVSLPKSGLMAEGVEDCVAVLQVEGTGPIIGASRLNDLTQAALN